MQPDSWLRFSFLGVALAASVWAIIDRSESISLGSALLLSLAAWLLAGVLAIVLLRYSTKRQARLGQFEDQRVLRLLPAVALAGVVAGAVGMDSLLKSDEGASSLLLSLLLPALVGALMLAVEFGTRPGQDRNDE